MPDRVLLDETGVRRMTWDKFRPARHQAYSRSHSASTSVVVMGDDRIFIIGLILTSDLA
jgi:hypothetical protein